MQHFCKTLLTIIFLLVLSFSFAQRRRSYSRNSFSFTVDRVGFYVGSGISQFTERVGPFADGDRDNYDNSVWIGFNPGVFVKSEIKNNFYTHIELGFNSKGGAATTDNPDVIVVNTQTSSQRSGTISRSFRLNYLEIPLMIGIRLDGRLGLNHNFGIGVSPSILLDQTFVESFEGTGIDPVKTELDLARTLNASLLLDYIAVTDTRVPVMFILRFFYSPFSPFKDSENNGFNYRTNMLGGTFGVGLLLDRN